MPEQKTLYGQEKMWQPNLGKDRTLPPIKDANKQIKDGIRIKNSQKYQRTVGYRPVTRGGSGGSYEPPHEITRSGFLICIKLLIQIIT